MIYLVQGCATVVLICAITSDSRTDDKHNCDDIPQLTA